MSGFGATTEDFALARQRLDAAAVELGAQLATVAQDVTDVLATWRGSAAAGFTAGWTEWHDGARRVLDALARSAGALGTSGDGYGRAEADTTAAINGTYP